MFAVCVCITGQYNICSRTRAMLIIIFYTLAVQSCDTVQCTSNNSYCNSSNNICQCIEGWTGQECSRPVCKEECSNGGHCIQPNMCQCVNGWSGPQCTVSVVLTDENCTTNCSEGKL